MSKINIGFVGTSKVAEEHLKIMKNMKNINLIGITSKTNILSKKIKIKYNISKIYNNYQEMILDEKIHALFIVVSADQSFKVIMVVSGLLVLKVMKDIGK